MSGISSEFLQEKLQKEFNPIHLVGEVYILYSVCAICAQKFSFPIWIFKMWTHVACIHVVSLLHVLYIKCSVSLYFTAFH